MLQTVANKSGVSIETLVDTVNLSLLHTSLWGARDLAARSGIQLSTNDVSIVAPTKDITYLDSKTYTSSMNFGCRDQGAKEREQQQQSNGLSR